jgi:hypothetical protein
MTCERDLLREASILPKSLALDLLDPDKQAELLRRMDQVELFPWTTREILPTLDHRGRLATVIEIIGLSEAGKSSLVSELSCLLISLSSELRVLIFHEFELVSEKLRKEIRGTGQQGLHFENWFWELAKRGTLDKAMEQLFGMRLEEVRQKRWGGPCLALVERGPHDILANRMWAEIMMSGLRELPRSQGEGGERARGWMNWRRYRYPQVDERLWMFLTTLELVGVVDAVVLCGGGVSLETAMDRREKAGLPREGRLTNPRTRPIIEKGYGWWLGSVFPLIREYYGTGLLVTDGEQDFEEMLAQVAAYCHCVVEVVEG